MGIKERRIAHKEALRQDIIDAARNLFKEEGSWTGVTMRKIADAINYSLPTIYEFFENKEDLLQELQHEGYATLCSMIAESLPSTEDPYAILDAIAQAYWDFAWKNPELYYMMHDQNMDPEDHKEAIIFIRNTVGNALQNIFSHRKKTLSESELNDTLDATRGIIHGFIMLSLVKSMKKEHAHHLMMQTLHDSIRSLII